MCNLCGRQFKSNAALQNHKKDSPKHKTLPNALRGISSSIARAPASSLNRKKEIVTAPEAGASRSAAKENGKFEEPLTDLEDPQYPLTLPRLGLHAPRIWLLNREQDIDIGLTGALAVHHAAFDFSVGAWALLFFETDPDGAETDNPVAWVSVEHQEGDTDSGFYDLVVTEVPAPWSPIPLSERDVVLNALRAQCHPIEDLTKEGYRTQAPSRVDIDMTRKCSDCGGKGSP